MNIPLNSGGRVKSLLILFKPRLILKSGNGETSKINNDNHFIKFPEMVDKQRKIAFVVKCGKNSHCPLKTGTKIC